MAVPPLILPSLGIALQQDGCVVEVTCGGLLEAPKARPRPLPRRRGGSKAKVGEQLLGTWHKGCVTKVEEQPLEQRPVEAQDTLRHAAEAEQVRMQMAFEAMAVYFQKLKPGALVVEAACFRV